MDDDQLTKLAVEELIKEGQKFVKRRELSYTFEEPTRMRPNLRYFRNTLKNCLSSNNRVERVRKSAAKKKQYSKKGQISRKVGEHNETRKPYSRSCKKVVETEKDTSKMSKHDSKKTKSSSEEEVGDFGHNCSPGTSSENNRKK